MALPKVRFVLFFLLVSGCSPGGAQNADAGIAANGAQSAACAKMLACLDAMSPGAAAGSSAAYGPNGTCWQTTKDIADNCTTLCTETLRGYAQNASAPSICRE
jgi:hypothetical protein